MKTDHDPHLRFHRLMIQAGCSRLWTMPGAPLTQPHTMECWIVPNGRGGNRGMLIAQLWDDNAGGVTCFADWPTGQTFDDLETLLAPDSLTLADLAAALSASAWASLKDTAQQHKQARKGGAK